MALARVLRFIDEAADSVALNHPRLPVPASIRIPMHANLTYCMDLRCGMRYRANKLNKHGYRRHAESFRQIVWDEANRLAHYEKRPIDFAIANRLNWSRILKRLDVEHPDWPPRFNALVALEIAKPPPIFFVVYCKDGEDLKIISLRLANVEERSIYAR